MTTDSEEEWRPVADFPGYEVSNLGRMRTWRPTGRYKCTEPLPRILVGTINNKGYRAVGMRRDGKSSTRPVHRLVAIAFLGSPTDERNICCHNDGSRDNNRVENLRWDTHTGNHADKIKHGTSVRGEDSPTSTLTEGQVMEIDAALRAGIQSQSEIARQFGVSQGNVGQICVGRTWGWLTGRSNTSQRGVGKGGYIRSWPGRQCVEA